MGLSSVSHHKSPIVFLNLAGRELVVEDSVFSCNFIFIPEHHLYREVPTFGQICMQHTPAHYRLSAVCIVFLWKDFSGYKKFKGLRSWTQTGFCAVRIIRTFNGFIL